MKNFITRAITGILFVAVLVGCILYSPFSFGFLFFIITALSVLEFGLLVNKYTDSHINVYIAGLGGAYLFMAFMCYSTDITNASVFLPYLLLLLYMMISELYLKRENPIGNWAHTMLSQVYVALPFALLNVISFQHDPTTSLVSFNPILPLSIFIFLWMSDTGAYCIGTLIGKHRLFERISPKKSWEGSIGGGVVAIIAAIALAHFFPIPMLRQFSARRLTHQLTAIASDSILYAFWQHLLPYTEELDLSSQHNQFLHIWMYHPSHMTPLAEALRSVHHNTSVPCTLLLQRYCILLNRRMQPLFDVRPLDLQASPSAPSPARTPTVVSLNSSLTTSGVCRSIDNTLHHRPCRRPPAGSCLR